MLPRTSDSQDHLLLMRVPSARLNAAQDAQSAPGDAPPSPGAPTCQWPLGCDSLIEERDVCGYHADKIRDLWADFDRGEMADGH
jgi:hypothetical protein